MSLEIYEYIHTPYWLYIDMSYIFVSVSNNTIYLYYIRFLRYNICTITYNK